MAAPRHHRPGPGRRAAAERPGIGEIALRLAPAHLCDRSALSVLAVYAGIDVTATALFSGARGTQLAARASLVESGALPARLGTRRPFTDLEAALDLRRHRPGTLPRHAPYLHQRTAGRIGSLARLIREAALTAILDGTERITKTTLDAVRLDRARLVLPPARRTERPAVGRGERRAPAGSDPRPPERPGRAARATAGRRP